MITPEPRALWRSDAEYFSGEGAHARILALLDALEAAERENARIAYVFSAEDTRLHNRLDEALARYDALVESLTALATEWECDTPTDLHARYCPGCHRASRVRALLPTPSDPTEPAQQTTCTKRPHNDNEVCECEERLARVLTHTRTKTPQGPDYCQECSEAISEWVPWSEDWHQTRITPPAPWIVGDDPIRDGAVADGC